MKVLLKNLLTENILEKRIIRNKIIPDNKDNKSITPAGKNLSSFMSTDKTNRERQDKAKNDLGVSGTTQGIKDSFNYNKDKAKRDASQSLKY